VTGDGDFVLITNAADMAEYEAISARLFLDDANIRRFRTNVVMGRLKMSPALSARDS
jgi:Lrp/AsnC family transcriptional regulator, leucine-responsive regulatory protein